MLTSDCTPKVAEARVSDTVVWTTSQDSTAEELVNQLSAPASSQASADTFHPLIEPLPVGMLQRIYKYSGSAYACVLGDDVHPSENPLPCLDQTPMRWLSDTFNAHVPLHVKPRQQ